MEDDKLNLENVSLPEVKNNTEETISESLDVNSVKSYEEIQSEVNALVKDHD